jgi:hypothetical protein
VPAWLEERLTQRFDCFRLWTDLSGLPATLTQATLASGSDHHWRRRSGARGGQTSR